jgi:hypothetical protein
MSILKKENSYLHYGPGKKISQPRYHPFQETFKRQTSYLPRLSRLEDGWETSEFAFEITIKLVSPKKD